MTLADVSAPATVFCTALSTAVSFCEGATAKRMANDSVACVLPEWGGALEGEGGGLAISGGGAWEGRGPGLKDSGAGARAVWSSPRDSAWEGKAHRDLPLQ